MYGEFDAVCVYGVKDCDKGEYVLSSECLETHGLRLFTTNTVRCYATEFVYGVVVKMEDVLAGTVRDDVKKRVQDFVDKSGGRYRAPTYYVALSGDFEIEPSTKRYECLECLE